MSQKSTLALLALSLVTGCCAHGQYRPCGPGFLNNILVPQGFAGADFRSACDRHDQCYSSGTCSRKECDDRFLSDILASCCCSPHNCLCRLRCWQWYCQVRLLGGLGYGRRNQDCGCPCGGQMSGCGNGSECCENQCGCQESCSVPFRCCRRPHLRHCRELDR